VLPLGVAYRRVDCLFEQTLKFLIADVCPTGLRRRQPPASRGVQSLEANPAVLEITKKLSSARARPAQTGNHRPCAPRATLFINEFANAHVGALRADSEFDFPLARRIRAHVTVCCHIDFDRPLTLF